MNDKKVDAELYALLQSYSLPVKMESGENRTIVKIKDLPSKTRMCAMLGIKSTKTLNSHVQYLIERGFVEITESGDYFLPNKEDIYFMIPLRTLQILNNSVQEQVIKIFIYLGQRWKYKPMYVFTTEEIAQHIGLKLEGNSRAYMTINDNLLVLSKLGLISYVVFYEDGKPRKRLTGFSLTI